MVTFAQTGSKSNHAHAYLLLLKSILYAALRHPTPPYAALRGPTLAYAALRHPSMPYAVLRRLTPPFVADADVQGGLQELAPFGVIDSRRLESSLRVQPWALRLSSLEGECERP